MSSDWLKNEDGETGNIAAAVAATAAEVTALSEYEYIPQLDVHYDRQTGYCFKEGLHDFHHASSHYTYHFDEQSSSWQCSYDPNWDDNVGCPASLDAFVLLSNLVDNIEIGENPADSAAATDDDRANAVEEDEMQAARSAMETMLPCIRAIVLESEEMPYGQLFIVTVDGAAIACLEDDDSAAGASGPTIADLNCEKPLCRIRFDSERKRFQLEKVLVDGKGTEGAEEGELIENQSVSVILNESMVEKETVDISHQDRLVVDCGGDAGYVMFALHIHQATNTCAGCEPGLLLSSVPSSSYSYTGSGSASTTTAAEATVVSKSSDLERERRRELKRIKKKYALSRIDYVQNEKSSSSALPDVYTDRADVRRRTVGSDLPRSAVEAMELSNGSAETSVSKPIHEENRGYQMLQKMGWKRGAGVGKREDGIQQPLAPVAHMDSSGLGSSSALRVAIGSQEQAHKRFKWSKAASRFAKIEKNPVFDALECENENGK